MQNPHFSKPKSELTFSNPKGSHKLKPRGRFFFALFFCFLTGRLFALPPQKILHPGDWAYDALAILSREQGRVFFADSRITVAEMERYLAQIDPDLLSQSGLAIYDTLDAYLKSDPGASFQSDALSIGIDLIFQPEFYYKTNENVPWIYNAHSRNPMILAPLSFSLGPWISAEMILNIGENEYAALSHNNYGNIPLDPVSHFDIHFPKRAYVSAGLPVGEASGFNLAIGIGDNFFGRTNTGSIIVSEYLERTVYAQASVYSPVFKYTTQVLQYGVNKYHYMHYLQVRPHRRFSISLAEGVMVNAPLELRFLNPFTIFHSHESYKTYTDYNTDLGHKQPDDDVKLEDLWDKDPDTKEDLYDRTYDPNGHSRIGSYLGVKLEWQPVQNLRLYGLFVMDVFNLPMKKTHWDDTLYPNAAGFQAGTEVSVPVSGGYWEFGLEGVYTYPYLYVMWDKGWSFFKEVPELDVMTNPPLSYWTGSPFGPDTIAGTVWTGFRARNGWYGRFSFEFAARGERSEFGIFETDNSVYDTYRPSNAVYGVTVSPTGTPIFSYTTNLYFEYSPKEWFAFAFQPGYRILANAGHVEGRTEHGFEMALSLRFRPLIKIRPTL